ncbi:MAG TPA: M1 family peptidase, partial [Streptomyces sp.]|nr:M1 family peptidase [Streptomyces sp.]
MRHRLIVASAVMAALMLTVPASAAEPSPGAPGAGDPYYPSYGNGGYDVSHYDLRLKYQPKSDELAGTATILAESTQELSSFNLDFALDVSEVRVNGRKADFTSSGSHELEVTPAQPLAKGEKFSV